MKEIIIAGFGGQGVLTAGIVLTSIASASGLSPICMPSYGAAVRGGKANCVVKYAEAEEEFIGSPAAEAADILIALNEPAMDFITYCKPESFVFANTGLISPNYAFPEGYQIQMIDLSDLAMKAGSIRASNLVALGCVIKKCRLFDPDFALEQMCAYFHSIGKDEYRMINTRAMQAGFDSV